ncbi:hypothetical protein IRT45_14065 [Nocardia sp. BSTN01]|nr:hypothetical protein [Nocardia sp. BSTN01]
MVRAEVEYRHPLELLQDYSNADKHRALRLCAAGTLSTTGDVPLADLDLGFRELEVGSVIATAAPNTSLIVELNSAVLMERPGSTAMVAPVAELSHLHRYVANVVVPVLITGVELPRSLPPQIELGDNGAASAERISRGEWAPAPERWASKTQERLADWVAKPPLRMAKHQG